MAKRDQTTKKSWVRRHSGRIAAGFDRLYLVDYDALERHQDLVAQSLTREVRALEQRFEQEAKGLTGAELAAYEDYRSDEFFDVEQLFPRLQWNAQYLVVYSNFEHVLQLLCKIVKRRSNFDVSVKDIEGRGVMRARTYLMKVAGVKSPFETSAAQRIKLLNDIRNAIAHQNGVIQDAKELDAQSLATRIRRDGAAELRRVDVETEEVEIVLNANFVRRAIEDFRQVIMDVANYELYPADDA
jgi:hypothetical protein